MPRCYPKLLYRGRSKAMLSGEHLDEEMYFNIEQRGWVQACNVDVCKDTEATPLVVNSQPGEDLGPKFQDFFGKPNSSEHSRVEEPFMEELVEDIASQPGTKLGIWQKLAITASRSLHIANRIKKATIRQKRPIASDRANPRIAYENSCCFREGFLEENVQVKAVDISDVQILTHLAISKQEISYSAPRVGARKAEKLSEIGVMKFNAKLPFKRVEFGVPEGAEPPSPIALGDSKEKDLSATVQWRHELSCVDDCPAFLNYNASGRNVLPLFSNNHKGKAEGDDMGYTLETQPVWEQPVQVWDPDKSVKDSPTIPSMHSTKWVCLEEERSGNQAT
ncbi:hypothetical protein KIL84_013054 [Mauremys mutica]|uniref:Uncharacterized protein n=1 Tax=Mauremys mutica TaxID=74926 RepID=A0A9D4B8F7_9SAUR|nr:hypothetical protein KIL84_013054 [Mauremys mutica]